jgi:outer membrane protein OmpA-like peptidoglycan-associated protein
VDLFFRANDMLKYIITGAVLSAALLWSYASDERIIRFIERDITTRLNSVAFKTPNDLFEYIVAGRDVIIQIREFGREDEIDTLLQQIAGIGGVDNIFLVGSVANPATARAIAALSRSGSNKLFVEIQIDNNVLTVTGNASAPEDTEIVLQKLRDSKGTEVNNNLDFDPGIPSSQWLKHLKVLTSRLPTAGTLLITESGVSRQGGLFGKAKISEIAAAAAETEAAVQCNQKLKVILGGSTISFKYDSDQLNLKSIQLLDQISKIVKSCANSVLAVEGHTDSSGSSDFNLQLSQRRANAVKSRLVLNGVDASAIEAVGFGESSPIASNETRKGRAENRRIEFIFRPTLVSASSTTDLSPDQQ